MYGMLGIVSPPISVLLHCIPLSITHAFSFLLSVTNLFWSTRTRTGYNIHRTGSVLILLQWLCNLDKDGYEIHVAPIDI